MKPLVSIIIPVFNGSNYMREAIDSALAQTYENIEIIVVNDGSRDDGKTEEIALSYGDKIRYVSKENGGSSSALNTGIRNMKGEYFSWLSHDDVYLPEKIEKQVEVMARFDPDTTMVVCSGMLMDGNGQPMLSKKRKLEGLKSPSRALSYLTHGKGINGCGVLIAKTVMDRVGFFDEDMVYLNDMDYWFRIMFAGINVVYTTDKLVKTRIHGQQVSVKKIAMFDQERHYLTNKLLDSMDQVKMDRYAALKQVSYFAASENLKDEYRRATEMLSQEQMGGFSIRVYLSFCWIKGYIIRCLKALRKRILFRR